MSRESVDKAIAKLGTPAEFYAHLDPDRIAEHIVEVMRPDVPFLVGELMWRENPQLWRALPRSLRTGIIERIQAQLPTVVGPVTDQIGEHIDQLLDPKVMVIDHFERIGEHLLDGPAGDRTRRLLVEALEPAIDVAIGPLAPAVRVAVGPRRFDQLCTSAALEAAHRTLVPLRDADFSARQATRIRALVAERCRELPSRDFVEMMRAAIKEDEWLLYAHGAIMGAAGGFLYLWIFGA